MSGFVPTAANPSSKCRTPNECPQSGSCTATSDRVLNGSKGPFVSTDTKGGERNFAADAQIRLHEVKADVQCVNWDYSTTATIKD